MANIDTGAPRGIGELASGLAGDVQDLVRGELALARAEVDQKVRGLFTIMVSVVGGALVAFAGLVVVLLGGAVLLTRWLPLWGALLVVGIVIVLVGGLIARTALASLSLKNIEPERTVTNVRKDARMIKEHS